MRFTYKSNYLLGCLGSHSVLGVVNKIFGACYASRQSSITQENRHFVINLTLLTKFNKMEQQITAYNWSLEPSDVDSIKERSRIGMDNDYEDLYPKLTFYQFNVPSLSRSRHSYARPIILTNSTDHPEKEELYCYTVSFLYLNGTVAGVRASRDSRIFNVVLNNKYIDVDKKEETKKILTEMHGTNCRVEEPSRWF